MLSVSRIFIGVGNMDSVERGYIVLHSPKFYLIKISKIYTYINFIGYALGTLILCLLLLIPEIGNPNETIVYNQRNCIGWYAIFMSFILFFVNTLLFTKESSPKFEMMKDQNKIEISIKVDDDTESKSVKNNKKKINLFKKKDNRDLEKIIEKSDMLEGLIPDDKEKDEINTDINTSEKLIVEEPKEEKKESDNILINNEEIKEDNKKKENKEEEKKEGERKENEPKSEEKDHLNIEKKNNNKESNDDNVIQGRKETTSQTGLSILSNNIDTGVNSSQILSIKQKKLINQIESKLDEFNEKSNFTNINLIPKNIDDLIMKERYNFGYLKINLIKFCIILSDVKSFNNFLVIIFF